MPDKTFGYCLNTSTIRGQGLSLPEMIDITAEAGYDGIEPWIREIDAYVEAGGRLPDLASRLADAGLTVPNLIGFFDWAVDDDDQRAAGLAEAKRNLELAAALGATGLASPPCGLTRRTDVPLDDLADRYAELIDLAKPTGVTPILEFWGASQTLGTLAEAMYVATASGRSGACILADIFHMYKGGSAFVGLDLLGPATLGLLHLNDYPASPPRDAITDADRVWPGDGVAPVSDILATLRDVGYRGMISLELFNETYYQLSARQAVRTGLEKIKQVVAAMENPA